MKIDIIDTRRKHFKRSEIKPCTKNYNPDSNFEHIENNMNKLFSGTDSPIIQIP